MSQAIGRKLAMAGECTSYTPTISELATVQATHLLGSFKRLHITLWYDNYRGYIAHNPDKSLNVTAIVVMHTTEVLQYLGLPGSDAIAQAVPRVVAYLVRCVGLPLQRSTVPAGPIPRTRVRAPLYVPRTAVVSLNWRFFPSSELKCRTHVELLEFVRGLDCVQLKTKRIVPVLIEMKNFCALLKISS